MSYETHIVSSQDNNSPAAYRRNAHFGSNVSYTSSVVVNLQKLQTDLQTQHQHEKHALNELNQRFHLFVDRVHLLESQNSKYLTQIADYRRQYRGDSGIDSQWSERYLHVQSDLTTLAYAKVDYESEFEWFQLQIGIYRQMIDGDQHWKDNRCLKLEQELKQLASDFIILRKSYSDLERVVQSNYAEREDMFKQYLALTYDWCKMKKHQKKWILCVEALKGYIAFYKNIRSYQGGEHNVIVRSDDTEQFWTLELEKCVKRIRQDFETFYASIYREMSSYYEKKIEEVRIEVEQPVVYVSTDTEAITLRIQTLTVEYEKVQVSLSSEREVSMKLEAKYSKLESEFRSLELYYQEQLDSRAQELYNAQESIMIMAYDIDEIRRSKINLEAEIIVYRYLLDINGTGGERIVINPPKQSVGSEIAGKFIAKRQKKGWVGIKECDVNGIYITLSNDSKSKDVDLSRWVVKRRIDSTADIRYTIPDGVRLERGHELRIYSKLGSKNSGGDEMSIQGSGSSWSQQRLVNNDLSSWGIGNTMETILFNQHGDEEASYTQTIALRRNTTHDDYQ